MTPKILAPLFAGVVAATLLAAPLSVLAQNAPAVIPAKAETSGETSAATKRPLTAQQTKLKDCGAKWQEEKRAKGVKGRDAWNKFRNDCLKS